MVLFFKHGTEAALCCLLHVSDSELTEIDTIRGVMDISLIVHTWLIAVFVDVILALPHLLTTIYHTQVVTHCSISIACIDPHQTGFVGKGSDHLLLIKLGQNFWLRLTTASKGGVSK